METEGGVYISIPISGRPADRVREHAELVKARLSREGWRRVVSPLDIYAGKDPRYADYIAADIRALMDCDAIFMCRGWQQSCGCNIEHAAARALIRFGKGLQRIIYETNDQ